MRLNYRTFQKHEGHLHGRGLHQACVHSQNIAFPKESTEEERRGRDRTKLQSHLVSPIHMRANTVSPK